MVFRETNGNHPNEPTFRNSTKQSSTAALSDASPSPPSNLQNSLSTSSLNPQQEANMDDEQRQKREIARRREEDRKRREVRIEKKKKKKRFNHLNNFLCLVSST